MSKSLLTVFPRPEDLAAIAAEDLAIIMFEFLRPDRLGRFSIGALVEQFFPLTGGGYPPGSKRETLMAIAEAVSWLESQGLVVEDPEQPTHFFAMTKRAKTLRHRADVEVYRKGRMLPVELLEPALADKVQPLFLRGDHDVAVFQAFKEVEVAVRKAAGALRAGFGDDLIGVNVMRKAFHPDTGPLTDKASVYGEREAEMHLFSGAIGHAKNPGSHRDVTMAPDEAARLIIFASYLLSIVERRRRST
jgi:uncharacterized protein (TIGR02391 family)